MGTTVTTTVVVDAPVEDVWDRLTDLGAYREWNPFITAADGTIDHDERLTLTIEPPGGRAMTFRPRVTTVDQHHHFEWLGRLGVPGIFDGRHSFTLIPMPGHRTLVKQSETFTGALVPFTGPMLDRTRVGFLAMNEALARHMSRNDDARDAAQ